MRGLAVLALLLLAACGGDEPRDGALSNDDERQLNEAAAMLDEGEAEEDGADDGQTEGDAGE